MGMGIYKNFYFALGVLPMASNHARQPQYYDNELEQRQRRSNSLQREQKEQRTQKKRKISAQEKSHVHVGSMDYTIYIVVTILVLIGVVMVFSASYVTTGNRERFGFDPFFFLRRNIIFALLGFVLMNAIARVSYELIKPFVYIIYAVTIGLLVAVMIIGVASGGAIRWLPMPVIGQFQPSEVAKAAMIFMMAFLVEKHPNALASWKGFFTFSAIVGVMTALVFYGGFSSALIVGAIGFGMIFVASPYLWRFIFAAGGAVASIVGYLMLMSMRLGEATEEGIRGGFRGARFDAWLDPFADPLNHGFQIVQSLYAIASGGWFGLGIGRSRQASFVPEAHNDIIFAIIVEELGFVGASMILLLFGVFIWRGIIVAINAPDTFSSMVAIGVVFSIALQAVINIAVVTNAIPNTGVTLPFISFGGTSLIVSMALTGVLLSISKYTKIKTTGS